MPPKPQSKTNGSQKAPKPGKNDPSTEKRDGSELLKTKYETFSRLVVAGVKPTEAYCRAGYKGSGGTAHTESSRILQIPEVAKRIDYLRKEDLKESKRIERMGKDRKLQILEAIAESCFENSTNRIAAIRAHNEMTGDNEPTVTVVDTGPGLLASLQARVAEVRSGLNLTETNIRRASTN